MLNNRIVKYLFSAKENERDFLEPEVYDVEVVPVGLAVCEKCGKQLPKDNMTLHLMHCERIIKLKSRMEADNTSNKNKNSKPVANNNKRQKKKKQRNSKIKVRERSEFKCILHF